MKDILSLLKDLRRPRLLIRAARHGVDEYQREQHLKRHLGYGRLPKNGAALMQLVEKERAMNDQRRSGDAGYSIVHHVDILIAIMGEARLLRTSPTVNTADTLA
ncbi:hypothetical protein SAMN05444000_106124 [Shimia gijangensis]|uniref:Uncharacterized protein n=1 Tax=Shimia gijangensis TaxID=1470563 RepID=A0A1M6HRH5_9RHOB|nr:DUF6477 family protein [Shimia gijangensis]SHJ24704.1 hypothetical protein SAMN05444000_106124 [Shimia gijangensis]